MVGLGRSRCEYGILNCFQRHTMALLSSICFQDVSNAPWWGERVYTKSIRLELREERHVPPRSPGHTHVHIEIMFISR